jgi:trehalose 6-phosphate phosphatase
VVLLGQYGLEREGTGTSTVIDARARRALGGVDLARVAAEARTALPGVRVEEKGGLAVTLHWRERPDLESAAAGWARAVAAHHGLDLASGRRAVELRPRVEIDKGSTVRDLVLGSAAPARALVVAGDDLGDLPAFDAAVRLVDEGHLEAALRIGVRSTEAPEDLAARTDLVVAGPHGLSQVLGVLARLALR